jgi:hypothetical protein
MSGALSVDCVLLVGFWSAVSVCSGVYKTRGLFLIREEVLHAARSQNE